SRRNCRYLLAVPRILHSGWWKLAAAGAVSEALLLGGSVAGNAFHPGPRGLDAAGCALLALGAASVPAALLWPLPAFVLALVTTSVYYSLAGSSESPLFLTVLAVLFIAAEPSRPWRSTVMGLVASAVVVGRAVATNGPAALDAAHLSGVAWIAAAILAGHAISAHRAYLASMRERARRAEETKELEAQRRVTEERLRIARELHDVVSHTISVINVQAGVAAHVLEQRPEQAAVALDAIKQASKEALRELRGILSVLRQVDEAEERQPAPRLADLGGLVEATRQAGLPVGLSISGSERALAPITELAVYRIVQESLTNALRYAHGGTAEVRLFFEDGHVTVDVSDDGRPVLEPVMGSGQGIIGMRERAVAAGGSLEAGPRPEGGFRVRAVLPVA
ncbi:MAG TPA: sensor histidine kinase, partial [Chloroflexota bacterium]|nr:sensor histidine kinase [Chloroflexota bacterium]